MHDTDRDRRQRDAQEFGYEPLSGRDISIHAARVDRLVRGRIRHALGRVGLDALDPDFFPDLLDLVEEACRDSHHRAWQDGVIQAGQESSKRTNAMINAMLSQ